MANATGRGHVFLFLQGPHGPFFARLAQRLREAGAGCWRVAFNAGDRAFWRDPASRVDDRGPARDWPQRMEALCAARGVTDIVLYGDTRPHHARAIAVARRLGLRVHVFEEGYLRPYWITYERDGANGHSRLMRIGIEEMRRALSQPAPDHPTPPDRWGDLRHHMLYGALYHWHVLFRNGGYPDYAPHRQIPVSQEFRLQLRRLAGLPLTALRRRLATARIRAGGFPYHVALLQLEHDASFRSFSDFASQTEFIEMVAAGFARGAPAHHHLVFKAHPLEDGRAPVARAIARAAREQGLEGRVHYVRGSKLARLIAAAESAVTVNSTAAHQALWRGIPVRAFGRSVYDKPGLVSQQPLPAFFADPVPPDPEAYAIYRRFLLETSQVPGGYYSSRGRAQVLRAVVDRMLAAHDPYDARQAASATARQHLRLVGG